MSKLVSLILVSGVGFLSATCEPSGDRALPFEPEFAKGGTKGGGAETVTVEFLGTLSLFGGAPSDYLAEAQTVRGGNTTRKISIRDVTFTLTVGYTGGDVAGCEDGGERLSQVLGTRVGELGVNVDKGAFENGEATFGVVVNFTAVGDDGSEYLLTTGGGANRLEETDFAWTRVAKNVGYVRVKRDGERKGALCSGIVDFEFIVSR